MSGAVSTGASVSSETSGGYAMKTSLHFEHRTFEPVGFKRFSSKLKRALHSLQVIIIVDPNGLSETFAKYFSKIS
jgi:hypothetical protein